MWQCAGRGRYGLQHYVGALAETVAATNSQSSLASGQALNETIAPGKPTQRGRQLRGWRAAASWAPSAACLAVRNPERHVAAIMFDSVNDACGSSSRTCTAFLLVARVHRSLARPVLCQDQSCLPAQHEVFVCDPFQALLLFACKLSAKVWMGV